MYVIVTHNGYKGEGGIVRRIDVNTLPSLKNWFDHGDWNNKPKKGTNYERLSERTDKGDTPYNLRDCAYMDDFSKQKIIFPAIMSKGPFFALDNGGFMVVAPGNVLTGNIQMEQLLLFLTTIGYWLLRRFYMGGGIEGELKVNRLEALPVPIWLANARSAEDYYIRYDFTTEEIKLISSSVKA